MLPELGVNGSLTSDCKDCPAKSKVFAKPGTVALPDYVNQSLLDNESLGGYLEVEPGHYHVFYLVITAPRRRVSTRSSRCSTTSPTSPLSSRRTPQIRGENSRSTQTSTPLVGTIISPFDPRRSSSALESSW